MQKPGEKTQKNGRTGLPPPEMTNYLIIFCAKIQRNKRKRLTGGRGCIRIKITILNDLSETF